MKATTQPGELGKSSQASDSDTLADQRDVLKRPLRAVCPPMRSEEDMIEWMGGLRSELPTVN